MRHQDSFRSETKNIRKNMIQKGKKFGYIGLC